MPALATADDVRDRLGRALTDSEAVSAGAYLSQASALVRHRFPTVDARITAGDLSAELVAGVVADAVVRVLRNPEGKVSEGVDDYSYRRSDATATGSLYLSAEEIALLTPRRSRVGSVALKQWWAD